MQIYRKVTSQILPAALDRVQNVRAREFIRACLSPDPDERPSAADLLNFGFLKDKNDEEVRGMVQKHIALALSCLQQRLWSARHGARVQVLHGSTWVVLHVASQHISSSIYIVLHIRSVLRAARARLV